MSRVYRDKYVLREGVVCELSGDVVAYYQLSPLFIIVKGEIITTEEDCNLQVSFSAFLLRLPDYFSGDMMENYEDNAPGIIPLIRDYILYWNGRAVLDLLKGVT